ncbi:MAG: carboxypeptidase-like regulatory domain-containing protein [Vicinamibacterales bacterium]
MVGRRRVIPVALVVVSLATPLIAQRGAGAPQGPFQQGAAGRFGTPARDAGQATAGTAVIRGRVLTAESGTPVRRAQVRATSAEARAGRLATTDAQGRFELKDLPAGRWILTASKAGLVTLQYGQRRPLESGKAIEIRDGETLERADISLPRGSAITGHVYDEFGDAVAGARIQVLRFQMQQGVRRLVPAGGGDQTDDTGAFRVFGLAPGEYFVSATLRSGPGADGADGTTYAPTYYPGTGSLAEAQRVALSVSQEQGNVNFALLPVRTVRVSGVALNSAGENLSGAAVTLSPSGDGALAFNLGANGGRVRSDGTFTVTNVTPGSYTLTVASGGPGGGRRGGGPPGVSEAEFATMPLLVGSEDLTGIAVVTAKGASLSGTVVVAEEASGELKTSGLQVVAQGTRPDLPGPFTANRNARVGDDAAFVMTGLSGQRLLRLNGLPQGWTLKAVTVDSSDVTDSPMDFRGNEQIGNVQIVVTDRVTEVNGKVVSGGQPARDYSVVLFAEDETKWTFPTRFVQTARPDQQGLFKIRALPPGERYLAVAVDYLENGEAADPQFLALVRGRATALTLADGESKAVDLTLVTR